MCVKKILTTKILTTEKIFVAVKIPPPLLLDVEIAATAARTQDARATGVSRPQACRDKVEAIRLETREQSVA
jgi:hypothetical protein